MKNLSFRAGICRTPPGTRKTQKQAGVGTGYAMDHSSKVVGDGCKTAADIIGCNRKWESLLEKSKQKRHGFHGFHGFVKKFSTMCWGRPLQFERIIREAF